MDLGARARHDLLSLGLLALGCSGPLASPSRPAARRAAPAQPAPVEQAAQPALGSLEELAREAVSRGHAPGRYRVRVVGDARARQAWRAGERVFPPGAVLAAVHVELKGGAPGPVLVMTKRAPGYFPEGNDWQYSFATPALRALRSGRLADCATCHALAPADGVFVSVAPPP
ncbi:MAG: hypothetical protein OZ921_07460 [Sorangiineae bacterium]|nr:hypothetical protein [Polyangiaceae bacterium]MEB2322334.1 hypothetical protein [Sorangiineae bacterium]